MGTTGLTREPTGWWKAGPGRPEDAEDPSGIQLGTGHLGGSQ